MATESEWLTASEAARFLGVPRPAIRRLGRDGRVRTRAIPGTHTRYHTEDLRALAESCTTRARTETTAA